ncbi:UDP-glucose:glycoprotein glucosyltransferase-domain-containing protein [Emericellopsis atlantica]|uniref:UDP-glucose:glycoprotein glucosyltransferase-domain-containing protein n=1 Tax=Emericellopsis atlantica TaxID=2614577 RepID=A0A9P7ZGG4_9HYPO|nr:UDP-glucose:glycoprotein glucosyltransferase-domain-containing protein [Emericellopsis atlantica]KAG9251674.1 UDP-glucose:glycoprotein glucosyltransferase-domain-containing protein [Emericellopsis atlantica]
MTFPPSISWGLRLVLASSAAVMASSSVNIGMQAAFPAAPFLLELIETAASENASSYFPLFDQVASRRFEHFTTEEAVYQAFVQLLQDEGHVSGPDALSTFDMALSLRSASPRIEAHYQYFETTVAPVIGAWEGCPNLVLFKGHQYCSPTLNKPMSENRIDLGNIDLPFDRPVGAGEDIVLYADPTSESFGAFHTMLSIAAYDGALRYKLRYRRSPNASHEPLPVSGYGVELALKRTDYIVIDDRESQRVGSQERLTAGTTFEEEDDITDVKPLSTSELAELGLKAATFIVESDQPLKNLVRLTQDIPKFAALIATKESSDAFAKEHRSNRQKLVAPGANYLWMNGVQLIERQIEPFNLVEMTRKERKLLRGVRDLGFTGSEAVALIGHKAVAASKSETGSPRYDWTDRTEDGQAIIWLNDLEKDERYTKYPKSARSLLQRTYPGQLPPIGLNIFHIVLPVDLGDTNDLEVIKQVLSLMERGLPVRFGLVPLTPNADAIARAKVGYYMTGEEGGEAFAEALKAGRFDTDTQALLATMDQKPPVGDDSKVLGDVLSSKEYDQHIESARHWLRRLSANGQTRSIFVDGFAIPRERNWMQAASLKLFEGLQVLQMGLFQGTIAETAWLAGQLLEDAAVTRNTYIAPEDEKSLKVLDVSKIYTTHAGLFDHIAVLHPQKGSSQEDWALLTVIADLSTQHGQQLLVAALGFQRENPGVRLDVVPNHHLTSTAYKVNSALCKTRLEKLGEQETLAEALDTVGDVEDNPAFNMALQNFLDEVQLPHGKQALLFNGRLIGPIAEDDLFVQADFGQLFEFEKKTRLQPVYEALKDLGLQDKLTEPLAAAKVTSLTALSTISDLPEGIFDSAPTVRSTLYDEWASKHTAIETGDPDTASVHLVGLLNPLSEQGQQWAPILETLSQLDGVYLKLFMNPKEKIEELPVKRFFRYALQPKPSFDEAGRLKPINATFKGLPSDTLLTTAMHVPPAWLVAPKACVHDLDNIKLSSVNGDVEALYELENILIEGHSREARGAPPKGAQLVLGTDAQSSLTDTIIMANLGYFQFKANPGYYAIKLKEGRSADIFTIDSLGTRGWEAAPGDEGTHVAVMDFQGTTLYPRLRRNAGMETMNVLADDEAEVEDSVISKGLKLAESWFGGISKKASNSNQEHAEINIFSVASGHLYERMLNIMMVSVMRNTKHTVKFWFIEQFLSPEFKDFIPHLAHEYGFQYEMVTYKWPHWLRHQKEKQREIWGYKILFLDVLFPLSLDKVIFVDADQIVRTDMIDLVNHDLEGAPYGFTPMCDSRTEMEGFRFWKQGYWANFLRGLPYHISALYVVDLGRFRELAAGDRLRQQYHTLSADPNSLSNLDQDLPNNMQFQIPIHSLPQEWLWCETWCSDESLASARTIDLCNNPETKEPKLDRARRQVPEWTVYDEEIAALDRQRRGLGEKKPTANINTKSRNFEEPPHTKDEL